MDKYERRRLRLIELKDLLCEKKQAMLAEKIGRDANYVSRMLYAEGKPGRKRIAEDMRDHIEKSFRLAPGWLDMPLKTPILRPGEEPPAGAQHVKAAPAPWPELTWPFDRVSAQQWELLTGKERAAIEGVVLALVGHHTEHEPAFKRGAFAPA